MHRWVNILSIFYRKKMYPVAIYEIYVYNHVRNAAKYPSPSMVAPTQIVSYHFCWSIPKLFAFWLCTADTCNSDMKGPFMCLCWVNPRLSLSLSLRLIYFIQSIVYVFDYSILIRWVQLKINIKLNLLQLGISILWLGYSLPVIIKSIAGH